MLTSADLTKKSDHCHRGQPVGGGGETRSGIEKRCSHNSNLQSGHPEWWQADNRSIFPRVDFYRSKKPGQGGLAARSGTEFT